MKAKLTAGIAGSSLVLLLFYQHGFLNNALLPGFYLSALMTASDGAVYGRLYNLLGLAISAVIFSFVIFCFFLSQKPLRGRVRFLTPLRIICAALFALFIIYALPIFAVVDAKFRVRNSPEMWIVPTPLQNLSIERSEGLKFSYFGYEFGR